MNPGGYFQPSRVAPQRPSFPEPPPQEEMVEAAPAVEAEMNAIPPDAVCYHSGEENCGNCEYMGPDGTCVYLQIQVDPQAHCNLWEMREGGTGEEGYAPAE